MNARGNKRNSNQLTPIVQRKNKKGSGDSSLESADLANTSASSSGGAELANTSVNVGASTSGGADLVNVG